MHSRLHRLFRLLVIGLFSSFVAVGCASFPGKELPAYTYDQITAPPAKLTVSYDIKAQTFGKDNARMATIVQEEIDKVLQASPLFTRVVPGVGTESINIHLSSAAEGIWRLPSSAASSRV